MHVHFEQNTCTRTDSDFLSLSWMGKVPEDLPEEGGGWKLDRSQYYVEGWLASGNARGVVGVTFSTSHCHGYDAPPRSNFNLRGHRSDQLLAGEVISSEMFSRQKQLLWHFRVVDHDPISGVDIVVVPLLPHPRLLLIQRLPSRPD
ncbi:hypothetical protein RRG08_046886 [Elysia crispata]|uniref:Uncharacterized protein n=1 Tax=Elysia crispata TaxID=231223 RepID=A0AAE0ZJ88_9GAST|nr:hypothetical protein RRG08_046886 [Elysia crispata]